MGQYLEIAADRARGLNWTVVNMSDRPGVDSLDLTNLPTPYADNQFDGIYSEHFIEHMHKSMEGELCFLLIVVGIFCTLRHYRIKINPIHHFFPRQVRP